MRAIIKLEYIGTIIRSKLINFSQLKFQSVSFLPEPQKSPLSTSSLLVLSPSTYPPTQSLKFQSPPTSIPLKRSLLFPFPGTSMLLPLGLPCY